MLKNKVVYSTQPEGMLDKWVLVCTIRYEHNSLCGHDASQDRRNAASTGIRFCHFAMTCDGNAHHTSSGFSGCCHTRPNRNHQHIQVRVTQASNVRYLRQLKVSLGIYQSLLLFVSFESRQTKVWRLSDYGNGPFGVFQSPVLVRGKV